MQEPSFDLLRFRRCRDLHGNPVTVTAGRRNGKPAAFIRPLSEDLSPAPEPQEFREQSRLYVNLNSIEGDTWRKLLGGQSIASIAKEEGVSRSAIYSRIQGNSKGQGGMVSKNYWVLLWWRVRQRILPL
jgi:hypothetical protein